MIGVGSDQNAGQGVPCSIDGRSCFDADCSGRLSGWCLLRSAMTMTTRIAFAILVWAAGPLAAHAAEPDRLFREQVVPILEMRCAFIAMARRLPRCWLPLATRAWAVEAAARADRQSCRASPIELAGGVHLGRQTRNAERLGPLGCGRGRGHPATGSRRSRLARRPDAGRQESHRYAAWWSLLPLVRPAVPQIDSPWVRNPIDAFVLARLRAGELEPGPAGRPADPDPPAVLST